MKDVTDTPFFRLLQTNENSPAVLKSAYGEFTELVFSGSAASGRGAYHQTLIRAGVELGALTEVSGKKYGNLSPQGHLSD
jgi:hypothetical protein